MSVNALPPLRLLPKLEAKLGYQLCDLIPGELDLDLLWLLTIVVEQWPNVDPETSFPEEFTDPLDVFYHVVRCIEEEAGHKAVPSAIVLRLRVDLYELTCHH